MYELPKIKWSRNVLFAASRDYAENVMSHLRLDGNTGMSLYRGWMVISLSALLLSIFTVEYLIP